MCNISIRINITTPKIQIYVFFVYCIQKMRGGGGYTQFVILFLKIISENNNFILKFVKIGNKIV